MDIAAPRERSFDNHIAGERTPPADGRRFASVNPATGKTWGHFAESGRADVDRAVRAAAAAFEGPWSRLSPTRRGRLMMAWGERIAEHAEEIAADRDRSRTASSSPRCAPRRRCVKDWLYYFGGLADKIEGRVIPLERASVLNYTLREPLGVVGVIMPWNSPTFLTIMAVAPALAAGNTVVLKPSEVTSASAIELARLAEEAGIPAGRHQRRHRRARDRRGAGRASAASPRSRSPAASRPAAGDRGDARRRAWPRARSSSAARAPTSSSATPNLDAGGGGRARRHLRGRGADLRRRLARLRPRERSTTTCVERLAKRARAASASATRCEPTTQMGPVATKAQLEKDERMVERAVAEGARAAVRRRAAPTVTGFPDGYFFEPTILHQTWHRTTSSCRNEVFGPVLCGDAVRRRGGGGRASPTARASGSPPACGRSTSAAPTAWRAGSQAGTVWINTYRALTFNSPFGGYKSSGIGRQNGIEAIDQYLQTKSVWCELGDEVQDPFVLRT